MIISVLTTSPHVHQYGLKQSYLTSGQVFKLDLSTSEGLEELKFLVSGANPNRPFIYVSEEVLKQYDLLEPKLELPINYVSEGKTLDNTLEELMKPSEVDNGFLEPKVQPYEHKVVNDSDTSNKSPEYISEVISEDSIVEEAAESEIEIPLLLPPPENKKEIRKAILEEKDWRELKEIAMGYKIEYTQKARTIQEILTFEFE